MQSTEHVLLTDNLTELMQGIEDSLMASTDARGE